jgi:BolA protein
MNQETAGERMRRKLTQAFAPILLEIEDESAQHAGHAGHRPSGETHFRVKIVSHAFKGLTKVASHRAVYAALAEEMQEGGIHALALDIKAEE